MSGSRIRGIAAGAGIAVGEAHVLEGRNVAPIRYVPPALVELEVERLRRAAVASRQAVEELRERLRATDGAAAASFLEPLAQMHADPLLLERTAETIRREGVNAEQAVVRAVVEVAAHLAASTSEFFRERADDVRHVGRHLVRALRGDRRLSLAAPVVLCAETLSPAELAAYPRGALLGLAIVSGTGTSHTALLARSLGIPAVVGARHLPLERLEGTTVIVDGLRGEVVCEPEEATRDEARARAERFTAFNAQLGARRDVPIATTDGVEVEVRANLEFPSEAAEVVRHGVSGVGLFRSEYLALASGVVPDEKEQTRVYEGLVRTLEGRPLVLRTFDLRGDKVLAPHALAAEVGLRRAKGAVPADETLDPQIRAVLRASALGPIGLLVPRVRRLADVDAVRGRLERCREELAAQGVPLGEVSFGIMIEVPSVALLAEQLASKVDFFAVGTNDLTQHTLGVDRSDADLAEAADALDPAVLELVGRAQRAARLSGIACSVCGDVASDPVAIPLLVGLGSVSFSVPRERVPLIAECVRRVSYTEAKVGVERALELPSADAVRAMTLERFAPRLADLWVEAGIDVQA